MTTLHPKYLETLKLYYEEEIEGEAYFFRMSERLDDPGHSAKMRLLGEVETYAAAAVKPLLDKYKLTPRPATELTASGRSQADAKPADWGLLLEEMRGTFPGYIDDFEALEAMAPAEDLAPLRTLTAHEIAAIAFLEREAKGDQSSTQPLVQYLKRFATNPAPG